MLMFYEKTRVYSLWNNVFYSIIVGSIWYFVWHPDDNWWRLGYEIMTFWLYAMIYDLVFGKRRFSWQLTPEQPHDYQDNRSN
jgi:hypothetical protein